MVAIHNSQLSALSADGFTIVPTAIDATMVAELMETLARSIGKSATGKRNGSLHALRNLLGIPSVRALSESTAMRGLVEPILGKAAHAVRGILFDKTPDANWKVAWHQDLSIAVKQRIDAPGYGPWSMKAGVQHVQPPIEVLGNMLTVRLHLDDCGEDNGPLRVLPGSHLSGVLSDESIARCRQETESVSCPCPAGGVLLMRPLLLHASSQALSPRHRRVIHIEYAGQPLAGGLEWYES